MFGDGDLKFRGCWSSMATRSPPPAATAWSSHGSSLPLSRRHRRRMSGWVSYLTFDTCVPLQLVVVPQRVVSVAAVPRRCVCEDAARRHSLRALQLQWQARHRVPPRADLVQHQALHHHELLLEQLHVRADELVEARNAQIVDADGAHRRVLCQVSRTVSREAHVRGVEDVLVHKAVFGVCCLEDELLNATRNAESLQSFRCHVAASREVHHKNGADERAEVDLLGVVPRVVLLLEKV
mmetsp:Transcript_45093/g.134617  ORF Transcript_45093/g.134617 Transcript_45093/m.134617 type:complete len:238 (+) Transcript_45093:136-849(+)